MISSWLGQTQIGLWWALGKGNESTGTVREYEWPIPPSVLGSFDGLVKFILDCPVCEEISRI